MRQGNDATMTPPTTASSEALARWKMEIREFAQTVRCDLHNVMQSLPAEIASRATRKQPAPLEKSTTTLECEAGETFDRLEALKRQLDEHLQGKRGQEPFLRSDIFSAADGGKKGP
jgi:hypothetical protein